MRDEAFQEDLFGGETGAKERRKGSFFPRYYKPRIISHIRVPVEYAIILAIGTLVLILVAYAIGVERGKKMQSIKPTIKVEEEKDKVLENTEKILVPSGFEEGVLEVKKVEVVKSNYTVQLVSLKSEKAARAEVDKLLTKGIKADFAKKGDWYPVYAIGFQTFEDANRTKNTLSKDYKDCFVRRVE